MHTTLGNFVQAHAEAAALYNEVTVLYLCKDPAVVRFEIEKSTEKGVVIYRVYYPTSGNRVIMRYKALRFAIAALKIKEGSFDIVQLNMVWNEGWQAVFMKKKFKLPFVITDNWTGYHPDQRGKLPWHIKKYMRWVANESALLMPVTEHLEKAMRNLGFKPKSVIIPNTVAVETFPMAKPDNTKVRFLHVSHLDEAHKNISGILQVWKVFSDKHPDVILNIGGDGAWQEMQNKAQNLGINPESIHCFGPQNREGVARLMHESHCLVLFSNYENLPLVMVEAMACGLSIIATSVGGIAEHISHHPHHCLIKRKDENALLAAFEKTKNDYLQVDRNTIRNYAVEKFSLNAVGKAFDEAYKRVLSNV